MSDQITAAGGKAETHIVATRRGHRASRLGCPPERRGGLSLRRSGPTRQPARRAGLANIGVRAPDLNWQLVHLYAPQALVKNSAMPPFRYLFELRKKIDGAPSPDALEFPQASAPPAGYEVVPTPEAKQLAAYLLSLKADAPLYEAPFTSVMTKP